MEPPVWGDARPEEECALSGRGWLETRWKHRHKHVKGMVLGSCWCPWHPYSDSSLDPPALTSLGIPDRRSPTLGKPLVYGNKVCHTSLVQVNKLMLERKGVINPTLYLNLGHFWSCPQWLGPKGEETVGNKSMTPPGAPVGNVWMESTRGSYGDFWLGLGWKWLGAQNG